MAAGDGLLVHCGAGIGRAGTVAVALLVDMGVPLEDALAHVAAHRPMAGPEAGPPTSSPPRGNRPEPVTSKATSRVSGWSSGVAAVGVDGEQRWPLADVDGHRRSARPLQRDAVLGSVGSIGRRPVGSLERGRQDRQGLRGQLVERAVAVDRVPRSTWAIASCPHEVG